MNHHDELNERIIESALKEGLITVKEAREMGMVFLHKYNFNRVQSTNTSTNSISHAHRL